MAPRQPAVGRLRHSQLGRACETLTQAFHNDPLIEYLIPDEAARTDRARFLHRAGVRYGLLYGEVYATPNVEGVAVWLVPGRTVVTRWGMLRAGVLLIRRKLGQEALARLTRYLECSAGVADTSAPGRHWHLFQLGVTPSSQGKGLGGSLIQPVLRRADEQGLPCCLDTFNARALEFYRRHGFRVVAETEVPAHGPRFWTMLRQPAPTPPD